MNFYKNRFFFAFPTKNIGASSVFNFLMILDQFNHFEIRLKTCFLVGLELN